MTKPYFRQVPNFEYVSRSPGDKYISEYVPVKNLFKRGKLREDIFGNLSFFEKYSIIGDERPDNVAFKFYRDSTLDWVILLSNNILNIQSEWPLSQTSFDTYVLDKYNDYNTLYNGIKHWKTTEIKDSNGTIIVPGGLIVDQNFSLQYYDNGEYQEARNFTIPVTNYEYEIELENSKRNIYILKQRYLNVVFNDMDDIMPYKRGSIQYVSETLKRGDNIRLYE
jgi:hypothetical protein